MLSALFAFLVLGLATNQVASGLALTILGLGLSGLIGASFVGTQREAIPAIHIPGLSDLPLVGQLVFGENPFVYLSLAMALAILWFLRRSRSGLTLRSIGEITSRPTRSGCRSCACACSPSFSAGDARGSRAHIYRSSIRLSGLRA